MGAFVISTRLDGSYKFSFAARRGKTVFTSIGFKQKADCEIVIATLKQDVTQFAFTRVRNAGGKYFFRLTKDGLVLANSRKYSTELLLSKGILAVQNHVAAADTLDFSDNAFEFPEIEAFA